MKIKLEINNTITAFNLNKLLFMLLSSKLKKLKGSHIKVNSFGLLQLSI